MTEQQIHETLAAPKAVVTVDIFLEAFREVAELLRRMVKTHETIADAYKATAEALPGRLNQIDSAIDRLDERLAVVQDRVEFLYTEADRAAFQRVNGFAQKGNNQ